MAVERIDPARTVVPRGRDGGTWTFHLEPLGGTTTRFIVRGRKQRNRTAPGLVWRYLTYELPHFVVERGMMLGIKARAERYGRDGSYLLQGSMRADGRTHFPCCSRSPVTTVQLVLSGGSRSGGTVRTTGRQSGGRGRRRGVVRTTDKGPFDHDQDDERDEGCRE